MKKLITSFFIVAGFSALAQTQTPANTAPVSPRTSSTSVKTQERVVAPDPYDVNDKYMGRKEEFLNSMIVKELPADFPVYDKTWGVKEYNAVVDAYFMQHLDLLKERVKQKIQYAIDQQKTK
jgi:hypothetical protein